MFKYIKQFFIYLKNFYRRFKLTQYLSEIKINNLLNEKNYRKPWKSPTFIKIRIEILVEIGKWNKSNTYFINSYFISYYISNKLKYNLDSIKKELEMLLASNYIRKIDTNLFLTQKGLKYVRHNWHKSSLNK